MGKETSGLRTIEFIPPSRRGSLIVSTAAIFLTVSFAPQPAFAQTADREEWLRRVTVTKESIKYFCDRIEGVPEELRGLQNTYSLMKLNLKISQGRVTATEQSSSGPVGSDAFRERNGRLWDLLERVDRWKKRVTDAQEDIDDAKEWLKFYQDSKKSKQDLLPILQANLRDAPPPPKDPPNDPFSHPEFDALDVIIKRAKENDLEIRVGSIADKLPNIIADGKKIEKQGALLDVPSRSVLLKVTRAAPSDEELYPDLQEFLELIGKKDKTLEEKIRLDGLSQTYIKIEEQIAARKQVRRIVKSRRPDVISGGNRKRTGIARALLDPAETLIVDEPKIEINIGYSIQNIPRSRLGTFDFFGGPGQNFKLGPDNVDGFGGEIKITIPGGPFNFGDGRKVWNEFSFGGTLLDGKKITTFTQPPGTQQVIGPPPGQPGAPFGLNNFTSFRTNVERDYFEGGYGVFTEIPVNRTSNWKYSAGFKVAAGGGSYDVKTDYTTGNAGGPNFNNFLNFKTNEFYFRPSLLVKARYNFPFGAENYITGNHIIRFGGEFEIGPSLHVTKTRIAACGSTDGTGGPCNGGFFQTRSTKRSTFIGGFASLKATIEGQLAENTTVFLQGGISGQLIQKNVFDTVNITTTRFRQPKSFQFGQAMVAGVTIKF